MVRLVVGSDSAVFGGLALFVLAGSGSLTVLLTWTAPPRTVMFLGVMALMVGVGVTVLATALPSAVAFFIGTTIAGVGFRAGFQGALRAVLPMAQPHERAGVLAILYIVSYLGLPAVVAGFLVVHGGGVLKTAQEYAVAVIVLAALALLGLARRPGDEQQNPHALERSPGERDILARAGCASA